MIQLLSAIEAGEVAQRRAGATGERQAGGLGVPAQPSGADPVRVAEQLAHDQAAAGFQDARELAQRRGLVGNLAEHRDQEGGVELASG